MVNEITSTNFSLHALFAAMGGLVRELNNPKNSLVKLVTGAFVGIFVGMVVFLLSKEVGLSEYMTAALTGLGGYSGTPMLDLLVNIVKKKLDI